MLSRSALCAAAFASYERGHIDREACLDRLAKAWMDHDEARARLDAIDNAAARAEADAAQGGHLAFAIDETAFQPGPRQRVRRAA